MIHGQTTLLTGYQTTYHNMDTIQQILGGQYAMFYHGKISSDQLTPLQTLTKCIDQANTAVKIHGRDLSTWPNWLQNRIAKLVRAHVIYQRLPIEPIRKPILVHRAHDQFIVDCGDTRLMALSQLPTPTIVPVILTCRIAAIDQYQSWTQIHNVKELSDCTGFNLDSSKIKTARAELDAEYALCWIEFGDYSTSHHLHDPQQRLNMMQQYLDQQPQNFQFDNSWLLKEINW